MKLAKQIEVEILQAYNNFWEANLSANMEVFASYLVDDFSIIGSANGEVFFNKQDAVNFYTATADQMRGKAELRNRKISIQPLDTNSVIVREECDLYVLMGGEWTFYGHARISCIAKHIDGSWKALHQHASFPDHRTEEGQQLASEKIEKENLELREAVKRRTVELESKTRELEIESSLERVRAVAMGMRKPDDMLDVCQIISKQLELLNVKDIRNVQTAIIYESKGTYLNYEYYVKHDKLLTTEVDYNLHTEHAAFVNKMLESPEAFYKQSFIGNELKDWYAYQKTTSQFADSFLEQAASLNYYMHSIGGVVLGMSTYAPLNEEEINVFKRFRNVFDLAYRRFVDIEKAEEQVREARIESGLERVRSRSLAMHNTSELQEVIHTVHKELLNLNIAIAGGSFIAINAEVETELHCWGSGGTANTSTEVHLPRFDKPFLSNLIQGIKNGPVFFSEEYTQQEKREFFAFLFEHEPWSALGADQKKEILTSPGGYTRSCCVSEHTSIFIINHFGEKFSEADNDILKRFTKVFEQTYRRFLDLQKAEAQARESEIELALERVRARTMAMQHSDELIDAAMVLFQQMEMLGAPSWNCSFNIWTEDKKHAIAWNATKEGFGRPFHSTSSEDVFLEFYTASQQGKDLFIREIGGKELALHYEYLSTVPGVRETIAELKTAGVKFPDYQVFNIAYFAQGYLMFITYEPVPQLHDTFKRFAKVFEQTYTRFLDLQKAEVQSRESQIQLALERVRARTMAMQHSDELADASFVLDSQVRGLGIQTHGCAFNIYGESDSEEWFSSEMGAMPKYRTPRENLFLRYYEAGKNGVKIHVEEYAGDRCKAHYEYLCTIPGMGDGLHEMIKAGGSFPVQQIDHAVYFKYGYLLFITLQPVPEAHEIFIRFTKVFEQTYTRFLDLQKAEAQALRAEQDIIEIKSARKKAEDALIELQITQRQLIQSEKMASLGELTAGIAHEIQNPLNFVNNFSEVSAELVNEMNDELQKGNTEDAKQLATDLKQNLEKINHHGKRAGDIVKGMLQHSRTSSGVKELTDINELADEYLRLAYHGLKAKDKSFNAKFETSLDTTLPKINIIPQDMGRVILNMINNAFYAVGEKQKLVGNKYNPTVIVSTKVSDNQVEIVIRDNGNGIPEKIKDKIFQPFFTTKPTGQGTGLGLSLAYDIVKAHGGELRVETKDGIGSTFTIQLPTK